MLENQHTIDKSDSDTPERTTATMHPLRQHLEAVGVALRHPKMANRARGRWERQSEGPTVSIAPPVTRARVAQMETTLGRALPSTLIEVLTEVTGDLALAWYFPATQIKTAWGYEVEPLVTPPDRFLEWSHGLNADGTPPSNVRRTAKFITGGVFFGVNSVLNAAKGFPFSGAFDHMRKIYTDPETLNHFDFIEEFMANGLPVLTAKNGDWLAIDLRDSDERLLHVSHEGEDAGIELDLTLPQFLTHLTWLGPVWPDFSEIFSFSNEVTELIEGDHRIKEASFDAEGEHGTAWREWFWQDVPPPRPHATLLRRT